MILLGNSLTIVGAVMMAPVLPKLGAEPGPTTLQADALIPLVAIVFTYREVQNRRQDAWPRDGEDNFERMRHELPATSHRLPCLVPTMDPCPTDRQPVSVKDQLWQPYERQSFASRHVAPLRPPLGSSHEPFRR